MKRNQPKLPIMAKVPTCPPPADMKLGAIVLGPAVSSSATLPTQLVRAPEPPIVGVSIESTKNFLNHLRMVRDTQAYMSEGAHNFREWTMKQFGDRLGIWLDETL